MPIATGLALGLAGISAAGALGGAAVASHGANSAAKAQVGAANYAADIQHQDAQAALDFQKQQYAATQGQIAPWLAAGRGGLANLSNLLGISPDSAMSPGTTASGGSANPNVAAGPTSDLMRARTGGLRGGNAPLSQLRMAGEFNEAGAAGPGVTNGNAMLTRGGTATAPRNTSLSSLINPSLGATGSLMQPFSEQFQAPTDVTEQNDPGYKFRLAQGLEALNNSAAARGTLLSGGTAKAINDYAQNSASSEYGNVYNRSLGEYQQRFNQFQIGQNDKFNRLAAISGIGQTAAGQLSSAGQAAAGNVSNILLNSGAQIGQNINNAGAARASGYASSANAFGNALTGGTNNLQQLLLLSQLRNAIPTGQESY